MLPDELLIIFLSKIQMQKIKIIYELHFGSIQISVLEARLNESRKKIKRIVDNINLDIEEFNLINDESLIIRIDKDKVMFTESIDDKIYVKIKDYLQEKYLISSGLYKSLLFILERRKFSILQLSENLSYSESHTYKLVNRIKEFLKVSKLGLRLSKQYETMLVLEGEETVIRLLHCLFLIIVSANNNWYLETVKEKEVEQIHTFVNSERSRFLSPSILKRVHIMIGVYESALKRGFRLSQFTVSVQEVGRIMNKEIEISQYFKYLYKQKFGETKCLDEELMHLVFVTNYLVQEHRSMEEKICLGKELYDNKNNSIIKTCVKLVNLIEEKHRLTENNYFFLIYALCNRLIVLHYFKLYKLVVPNRISNKGELQTFIKDCIYKTLKKYRNKPSYREIEFNFIQVIVACINLDVPIKVYIEFQNKPEYNLTLKNILKSIYKSEVLDVTEDYKVADVVISDSSLVKINKKYFYFQDIFDQLAWSNLSSYLNEEIKQKKLGG